MASAACTGARGGVAEALKYARRVYALGTPGRKVIIMVTLRAARAGVITGVLLVVVRIAGETHRCCLPH